MGSDSGIELIPEGPGLGRLTEDGEPLVFRATREILEDLNSSKPQSSTEV